MKTFHIFSIILLTLSISYAQQSGIIQHKLHVIIKPNTSYIEVLDSISLSESSKKSFLLNSKFEPISKTAGVRLVKVKKDEKAQDVGMDRDSDSSQELSLTPWKIIGNNQEFVISYQANLSSEIEQSKANYQRGFSETSGIISSKGVYLAGSTYWIAQFDGQLMTFDLTTELPSDWRVVSQGKRMAEKTTAQKHLDTWRCDKPQEEIFLISAAFHEYSYTMNSGIEAMAFLRTDDEGLANKYLEVTEQYMTMYQSLLGDYPYSKFALVENFWETGYGMPSFTLLGEKIIRFPFILHSSYPHELLHNWWGNSVYVDFESGNWCEGTTAFMADHLIKEQRGAGEEE